MEAKQDDNLMDCVNDDVRELFQHFFGGIYGTTFNGLIVFVFQLWKKFLKFCRLILNGHCLWRASKSVSNKFSLINRSESL